MRLMSLSVEQNNKNKNFSQLNNLGENLTRCVYVCVKSIIIYVCRKNKNKQSI